MAPFGLKSHIMDKNHSYGPFSHILGLFEGLYTASMALFSLNFATEPYPLPEFDMFVSAVALNMVHLIYSFFIKSLFEVVRIYFI